MAKLQKLNCSVGLLASAIIKLDGTAGQAGWRWIFILEGIATVLIALTSMIFLPADIASAKFFTEEEREFAGQYDYVAVELSQYSDCFLGSA